MMSVRQDDRLRLLADGPGQEHALLLAVADLHEIALSKIPGMHQCNCLPDLCLSFSERIPSLPV